MLHAAKLVLGLRSCCASPAAAGQDTLSEWLLNKIDHSRARGVRLSSCQGWLWLTGKCCTLPAGVTVIGEVNALTSHLMNVLWLLGTFTFATVIGIITEDVTQTIMARFFWTDSVCLTCRAVHAG